MVNNYNLIFDFCSNIGYLNLPVLTIFMYRKQDLDEISYNKMKSKKYCEIYTSIKDIDMNYIETECCSRGCRCYIMFLDKMVMKLLLKMKLSLTRFREYLDTELLHEPSGLHLIDVDSNDPKDLDGIISWLNMCNVKSSSILTIPTKTGYSIVFKGDSSLIELYENTLYTQHTAHLAASMNLFIPDFHD